MWGTNVNRLRTTALALALEYSIEEYCAPVWLNIVHIQNVDVQLNQSLRIIKGNIK